MRVLIVGCGYVGIPLGAELVRQGHEVVGVRRSEDAPAALAEAGIKCCQADITQPGALEKIPGPFDWVVNAVSSSKGGAEQYREVYLQGTKNLVAWLSRQDPPVKKYVYTSSTSVYGQVNGTAVKETSPTEPQVETAKVLVETEGALLGAFQKTKFPAVILRVAGIYGPGRGHLFLQYLKNEARISGDGSRIINMIHLDDLFGAIISALRNGRPGEIYNVVDDEPVTQMHFFTWLSETLGKWLPPKSSPEEEAARKRGVTNKKVQNRRMRMELGCALKYPNFRQGYTAEIKRLDDAGELDISPEPR